MTIEKGNIASKNNKRNIVYMLNRGSMLNVTERISWLATGLLLY